MDADDLPPDPAPNVMLIDGFTLKGTYDDGTPFVHRSDLAIVTIGDEGETDAQA